MDSPSRGPATLSLPSDVEILVVRELPAPKALVFEAWTRPDYVRAWYSCREFPMTIAAMDLREGGRWRWSLRDAANGVDHVYSGEYRESSAPIASSSPSATMREPTANGSSRSPSPSRVRG